MFRKIAVLLAITLCSSGSLLLPKEVSAQSPLTRAVVESLRNQVRLIRQNQSARPARPSDAMNPGDSLATAKASMAQLRFNDGSLARLGEQAVFRFVSGTRTFNLSNGTALLLIPPGKGKSGVRTPNAAAGIRGSALFVRYIPETDTTIVGALTNSGIEVFNQTASQRQELKAGYMAVIVKDRIERVYEFDLNAFYQTSELVKGLNLTRTDSTATADEAIASVQAETVQAIQAQSPVNGEQVIENPSFVQLPATTSEDFPSIDINVIDTNPISGDLNSDRFENPLDTRLLLEGGEIRETQSRDRNVGGGGQGGGDGGGDGGQGGGDDGGDDDGGDDDGGDGGDDDGGDDDGNNGNNGGDNNTGDGNNGGDNNTGDGNNGGDNNTGDGNNGGDNNTGDNGNSQSNP